MAITTTNEEKVLVDKNSQTKLEGRYNIAAALIGAAAVILAAVIGAYFTNENNILKKEIDSLRAENTALESEVEGLRKINVDLQAVVSGRVFQLKDLETKESSRFWQETLSGGDAINKYGFNAEYNYKDDDMAPDDLHTYAIYDLKGHYTNFSGRIETTAYTYNRYESGDVEKNSLPMLFEVTLDDETDEYKIAISKEIYDYDKSVPFSVDISGAKTMKITWLRDIGSPGEIAGGNFNCYVVDTVIR